MLSNRLVLALLAVTGLIACGGEESGDGGESAESESSLTSGPSQVVTFESDGTVRGPREISPGLVKVRYAKRRSICPVSAADLAQPPFSTIHWVGNAKVDMPNGRPQGAPIDDMYFEGAGAYGEGTVFVPATATRLSLWFNRTKADGNVDCWDSNGGKNYAFKVAPAPVIWFNRDGTVSGPPSLKADRVVEVRFDPTRSVCRPQDAFPGRGRDLFFSVDNRPMQWLATAMGPAASGVAVGSLLVPPGGKVAFWASMPLRTGGVCWDSNGGKNFVFEIR